MPCFPSLARAEKKLLRLAGAEGFPVHVSFRKGNKTAIMAAARKQKGRYAPVGVRPPPPLRGSSPCEAGQFIPVGFDCRHSEVCKSRNSVLLNSLNSFFQMVLNPQEYWLFQDSRIRKLAKAYTRQVFRGFCKDAKKVYLLGRDAFFCIQSVKNRYL